MAGILGVWENASGLALFDSLVGAVLSRGDCIREALNASLLILT